MNKIKALLSLVECEMKRYYDPFWSDSKDLILDDIASILEIASLLSSAKISKKALKSHFDTLDTELRDTISCFLKNEDHIHQAMYDCGYIDHDDIAKIY
tara:strand:+ start:655 stop:951 length:297 start_codon:yes stop_codon:yes gene_type:complete